LSFHGNGIRGGPIAPVERILVPFLTLSLGERPRLSFTARIERAHSYRARSASKEDTWPLPSQRSERPLEELLSEGHVLLDVRL
jgi:hypothetical protein